MTIEAGSQALAADILRLTLSRDAEGALTFLAAELDSEDTEEYLDTTESWTDLKHVTFDATNKKFVKFDMEIKGSEGTLRVRVGSTYSPEQATTGVSYSWHDVIIDLREAGLGGSQDFYLQGITSGTGYLYNRGFDCHAVDKLWEA